ncbi:MAG: glycoside hydrolase family 65 protein [Anaerolineae bacterium]
MELQNNVHTDTLWEIYETHFEPEQLVTTGSNYMIGNGYLGYRGTFAEWDAERYVACIVTDTWDKAEPEAMRELCNVPNGLYVRLEVNGEPLSIFAGTTRDYRRTLDLRHGVNTRRQTWENSTGQAVTVEVEKFASYDNLHLVPLRYTVRAETDMELTLITGIDGRVWSLSGEHFKSYETLQDGALIAMETRTVEFDTQIDVVEGVNLLGAAPKSTEIVEYERRIFRRMTFALHAGDELTLEKIIGIYHSNDVDHPREKAMAAVRAGLKAGHDALKAAHAAHWDAIWDASDVEIEGNPEAQLLTRFNLYQNIIATPTHARLPIGARGLSCQVYQGAAFWDQEIFNLPVFLYTQPDVARNILEYRYVTLDGARKKAKRLGYYGAYYAWTSGKTGEELFPDFFFTDVLTGRKVRNHFNDWQIHISPDIVYALWQYYLATQDWTFIVDYGAEITFEVAQFLVSHAYFKKDKHRYEFIRLLGPDEYHENVDNNAFTNYQARFALDTAVTLYERLQTEAPDRLAALFEQLELDEDDVANWREMVDLIYLPQPDPETKLIEQCDGFFELEDTTPEELRERLIDPEEYWGWPNGVAVHAQVLKQADVLQLFALHDIFPLDVQRANYDYYEPRTEHGSSLSPSVHALIAARVGYAEEAYRYFMIASTIDLYNKSKKVMSGGTFLGGIHTAAAGGVWQVIVQGFAGFEVQNDGISFRPALPAQWDALAFKIIYRSNPLHVRLTHQTLTVTSAAKNTAPVAITVGDQTQTVAPGDRVTFDA